MIKLILNPFIRNIFVGKCVPLYNWIGEKNNNWYQVIYHRPTVKGKITEEWAGGKVE